MDAIRGSNRFGSSGTPDALIDDPRTEGDVWAEVQAADLVPFPVDPPGGWQHGQDGFDAGFDVGGFDAALDAGPGNGIDFNAGSLQLADGVDFASDIAAFDGGAGPIGSTFTGLDAISTADPSDGMDSLEDVDGVGDVQIGAANWGLEFLTLDGEDTPPIAALDAASDLTWADLAPGVERFDGVDPDLDLDAPLVLADLASFDDLAQLDRHQGDDFVGAPLPMFVLDRLSSLELDQVEALSPMAQDTAAPRFLSEDDVFGDQYQTDLD
jgi:hypothetical protein